MTDSRDMSPGPAGGDGATGLGWSTRGGRALIVCTGNVCRSPYMERRLARALAGTGVEVVSAGTSALTCEGIDPGSVERLRKVGAHVDHFTATQLTGQVVAQADLVLTASREHRGQVVQLHPKALRYCFTWADFADLVDGLDAAGLGRPGPDQTWVAHVAAVAAARRGTIPPRSKEEADILDPYGRGPEKFYLMAEQIEKSLAPIVAVLTPR